MEPKKIFESAQQFEQTANFLAQQLGKPSSNMPVAPFIVNTTFSIELYLKCLLVIETKKQPKKTHQLHTLFNLLSSNSKKDITNEFNKLMNAHPITSMAKQHIPHLKTDIDSVLLGMNQAFEQWRYISMDGSPESSVIGSDVLITSIKKRINSLRGSQ